MTALISFFTFCKILLNQCTLDDGLQEKKSVVKQSAMNAIVLVSFIDKILSIKVKSFFQKKMLNSF